MVQHATWALMQDFLEKECASITIDRPSIVGGNFRASVTFVCGGVGETLYADAPKPEDATSKVLSACLDLIRATYPAGEIRGAA
jgi:hypothetical protein